MALFFLVSLSTAAFSQCPPGSLEIDLGSEETMLGSVTGNGGDKLFLCSVSRDDGNIQGWILKFGACSEDTLSLWLPQEDTGGLLYTGFVTHQQTYCFIGTKPGLDIQGQPLVPLLWIFETDTLLQVIRSQTYDVFFGYHQVDEIKGVWNENGPEFYFAGNARSVSTGWPEEDVFFGSVDREGNLIHFRLVQLPYPNQIESMTCGKGNGFEVVGSGFAAGSWLQWMSLDTSLHMTIVRPVQVSGFQEDCRSMVWKSDTSILVCYSRQLNNGATDLVLEEIAESGNSLNQWLVGDPWQWDLPAKVQALVRAQDSGFWFFATMDMGNTQNTSVLKLIHYDQQMNLVWSADLLGQPKREAVMVQPGEGEGCFLAIRFSETGTGDGLCFFYLDSLMAGFQPNENNERKGGAYRLFPNPGKEYVQLRPGEGLSGVLYIYNVNNELVKGPQKFIPGQRFDTSSLRPGSYFFKLISDKGKSEFLKWIKIK